MQTSPLFAFLASLFIASVSQAVVAQIPDKQLTLMSRAAPAVVMVSTPSGHGTGFFVSDDGWVVTNYHVVANAPVDPKTGYRVCKLHLTKIKTNADAEVVDPYKQPVWGTVYKASKQKDLALIFADEFPEGINRSPFLKLSSKAAKIGTECFTIGMPKAGVLWAIRSGTVSGYGIYPNEIEGKNLGTNSRLQQGAVIGLDGPYQVTLTTCGTNPGDSGGPLFNADAEIIAVNHSIPLIEGQINLDKFSYHIHRDELAEFLSYLPKTPEVIPPPLKHPATKFSHRALEGNDCKVVTLFIPVDDLHPEVTVTMVDLDGRAPILADEQLLRVLQLSEEEYLKQLSIDWAYVVKKNNPTSHFFDLNQDGVFEYVIVEPIEDGSQAHEYSLKEDAWRFLSVAENSLDIVKFASPQLNRAYSQVREQLVKFQSR
jgi:S1-C subfamily serine protease